METKEYPLENKWVVWYHKLYDDNWGIEAYKKLYEFNTIEGFWKGYNVHSKCLRKGLIFLMKDGILPIWETPENINGCAISLLSDNPKQMWRELCMGVVSNQFIVNNNEINGISSCPKKRNILFKLWMKGCEDPVLHSDYRIDMTKAQKKIYQQSINREKEVK